MSAPARKWAHGGERLAALILILWAASGVWWFRAGGPAYTTTSMVQISQGRVGLVALWPERPRGKEGWESQVMWLQEPALEWGWQYSLTPHRSIVLLIVNVPLWMPFAAVLGATFLVRWLAREKPGACRKCGYDLRAAALTVCPECGTAAGAAKQVKSAAAGRRRSIRHDAKPAVGFLSDG